MVYPTPVPVIGSFAATGQSASYPASGRFNVTLSGTWVGTVKIERSFDNGTTWVVVSADSAGAEAAYTAPMSLVVDEPAEALYRLNCTAFTSGPIPYRIG